MRVFNIHATERVFIINVTECVFNINVTEHVFIINVTEHVFNINVTERVFNINVTERVFNINVTERAVLKHSRAAIPGELKHMWCTSATVNHFRANRNVEKTIKITTLRDKHAHVCTYIELYSVLLHVLLRISDIMGVEGDGVLSVPYIVMNLYSFSMVVLCKQGWLWLCVDIFAFQSPSHPESFQQLLQSCLVKEPSFRTFALNPQDILVTS